MEAETGKLIICPTPLGNLRDMPPRAKDALLAADVVCCEDTRVTGKLLAALGVEGKRLERLDEEVLGRRADSVVDRILSGEVVVYCSDAGMPSVSDPGARLIARARQAGAQVEVLPGPTAAATAYVASGFSCPRFYFAGFFPRKANERSAALQTASSLNAVTIFYESPHRLSACLNAIAEKLPARLVAVCRELTKLHEEIVVDSAAHLAEEFERRAATGDIKGEIVVVIDAPSEEEELVASEQSESQARAKAAELLAEGTMRKKDIVAFLQSEYGISRNMAYHLVHGA